MQSPLERGKPFRETLLYGPVIGDRQSGGQGQLAMDTETRTEQTPEAADEEENSSRTFETNDASHQSRFIGVQVTHGVPFSHKRLRLQNTMNKDAAV